MKSIQLIAILLFFCSCNSQKLAIHVEKWKPYCGGAKPTEEISRGLKTPFSDEKFKLYFKGETASDKIISLDENGNWKDSTNATMVITWKELQATDGLTGFRVEVSSDGGKNCCGAAEKSCYLCFGPWRVESHFWWPRYRQ